ncbi:MAG: Asp23/Gls24 family envelope stress response protein [Actinobacteria bacterium]|nr:Asp23/Gls24 family envelope stress response protein [Actinomycetota bacterium]
MTETVTTKSTPVGTGVTTAGTTARQGTVGRGIDVSGAEGTGGGTTTIQENVVAKIAGIAARDVRGVHALGGGAARAIGALRERVGRADVTQGIGVEVGEKQAAADVVLVVEYGVPIQDVAQDVRRSIVTAVEEMTGLQVTEVNVLVSDVFVAGDADDDADADQPRRVQ